MSPIVVVPKKNGKFKIYVDFKKKNVVTKKDPYPLSFTNEVLNIVAGHDAHSFLTGYLGYHQICITTQDKYKTTLVIDWGAFTLVEIGQNVTILFAIFVVFIQKNNLCPITCKCNQFSHSPMSMERCIFCILKGIFGYIWFYKCIL